MAADLPTIGFVGVGSMGTPMVRQLLRAGYRLVVFDINGERVAAVVSDGASAAESAADAAKRAEIVMTSLHSSAIFVEVADGSFVPNARPGQVFIDLGTTTPPEARRIAAALAARGAALLDVLVSGGPPGCENGNLRMFAGGDRAAYDKCRPILEILGEPQRIVYCGPSGMGQVVKGVNQLVMGLPLAGYMEAVAFGVRAGADPDAICNGVGGDSGWRKDFESVARMIFDGKYTQLYVKFPELPYFLREAREKGFPMPMTQALFQFCDAGERTMVDNMGRPAASFWHELITRGAPDSDDPA
ncbi:MAG: NAD(P)-dependent oxidoreductase [Planctomycetes bacterium]|nr:NAD(P)-dependent oxidoreductase [Planctomycetota bacterium]